MSQEITKAFVVGGYSEFEESLVPLVNALDSGPDRIVDEAEPITLNWAIENIDRLADESERRLVIGHSFGAMTVKRAGIFVILNGVEPTPIFKSALSAMKVNFNSKMGKEDHVPKFGMQYPLRELWRNRHVSFHVPLATRDLSSVDKLINGGTVAYPGGRFYIPRDRDEFGFGHKDEVSRARQNGITAEMMTGFHNQPLAHPNATAKEIYDLLNKPS